MRLKHKLLRSMWVIGEVKRKISQTSREIARDVIMGMVRREEGFQRVMKGLAGGWPIWMLSGGDRHGGQCRLSRLMVMLAYKDGGAP